MLFRLIRYLKSCKNRNFFNVKLLSALPRRPPQEGPLTTPKNAFLALVGLWGASGVPGPPLGTISGFLWSHLWSWKLSGALFGCIWGLFGLLFELVGTPWDHIFQNFGHNFCFTNGCIIKNIFLFVPFPFWFPRNYGSDIID